MHLVLSYYIRPSVFAYTCRMNDPALTSVGSIYHDPHLSFAMHQTNKQIVSPCISLDALQGYLPTKGSDGKRAAISFTKAASSSIDRRRLRLSKPISLSISLSLSLFSFTIPSKSYIFLWSLRIWFAPSWYSFSNSLRILKTPS